MLSSLSYESERMGDAEYFIEKARQCRRLARAAVNQRVIEDLEAMAQEFDDKAKLAERASGTPNLLQDNIAQAPQSKPGVGYT